MGSADSPKKSLEHKVTRSHRNAYILLRVYTDAFDLLRSRTVTQTPSEDLSRPHIDQHPKPLEVLS